MIFGHIIGQQIKSTKGKLLVSLIVWLLYNFSLKFVISKKAHYTSNKTNTA